MTARWFTNAGLVAAALGLLTGAPAAAQKADDITNIVPDEDIAQANGREGWDGTLSIGANLNLAGNRNVVGQVDGRSYLMGLSVLGALEYTRGQHEWRNNLSLTETWARTPAIDQFIKANDLLEISSMYNYFIRDWTGLFGRLSVETTIFDTNAVTGDEVQYSRDGTGPFDSSRDFALSDAFSPFTLNESVGWFAEPVESEKLNVQLRAGFGGRHTFADGVRFLGAEKECSGTADGDPIADCTAGTKYTPYQVLSDVHQAGLELYAGLDGKAQQGRLTYYAGGSALFPLLNNDAQDRGIGELTKVALQAGVGVGVFEWMTLNYTVRAVLDRQLLTVEDGHDWQIQNSLLLTISYTLIDRKPGPDAATGGDS